MDKKQSIKEAAAKSFSMFGYKATTMDQVAKIANVGKGTIYNFYSNKEELFGDIVSAIICEMREVADRAIDPELTFHENAHRALVRILEFRKEHQLTIKLIQEEKELGTPIVKEELQKVEQVIVAYIQDKIDVAIAKGDIIPCDSELTAFLMLKFYFALIVDWEKNHEALSKEKIAELFELYFFKGLSV
ncbi:TetR/AcrR family transcriptional regulator [Bacillus haimaensis]|uniref:TetR/AcrR family transcriptional regulator n=1 Tax=Bacillus haimaensis TaxID=3160967 RepID=UPI003AA99B03